MVKEIDYTGKIYFQCEACETSYLEREIAQRCENFCRENKACNTDLMRQGIHIHKEVQTKAV